MKNVFVIIAIPVFFIAGITEWNTFQQLSGETATLIPADNVQDTNRVIHFNPAECKDKTVVVKVQEHSDTDVEFAYRFMDNADPSQGFYIQTRFVPYFQQENKPPKIAQTALQINPYTLTLINANDKTNLAATPITVSHMSEPNTWYKVYIRTIGTDATTASGSSVQIWIQPRENAIPWPDAIHSQKPVLTNGAIPLYASETQYFRINYIMNELPNTDALQIADIKINACPVASPGDNACTVLNLDKPKFSGHIQVWPSILDFGCLLSPNTSITSTITLANKDTENASGMLYVPAPFTVIGDVSYDIAPGATQTRTIQFTPEESNKTYDIEAQAYDTDAAIVRLVGNAITSVSTIASGVRINELLPWNTNGILDETGAYADWIEVYNTNNAAVDISGWILSHTSNAPGSTTVSWTFPKGTIITANGYFVLYATTAVTPPTAPASEPFHCGFELDEKNGGRLVLSVPDADKSPDAYTSVMKYDSAMDKGPNWSFAVEQ